MVFLRLLCRFRLRRWRRRCTERYLRPILVPGIVLVRCCFPAVIILVTIFVIMDGIVFGAVIILSCRAVFRIGIPFLGIFLLAVRIRCLGSFRL